MTRLNSIVAQREVLGATRAANQISIGRKGADQLQDGISPQPSGGWC